MEGKGMKSMKTVITVVPKKLRKYNGKAIKKKGLNYVIEIDLDSITCYRDLFSVLVHEFCHVALSMVQGGSRFDPREEKLCSKIGDFARMVLQTSLK
jgi:hypothetical protein